MTTVDDYVQAIPHTYLKESKDTPEIGIWADYTSYEDEQARVILKIGAGYGEQMRFVDMSVRQARDLANALLKMATEVTDTIYDAQQKERA